MLTLIDLKPIPEINTTYAQQEIPNEQVKTLYASRYYEGSLALHNLNKELNLCKNTESVCLWTKRPDLILKNINFYKNYKILCFITVNSYDAVLEPNVPNKGKVIIPAFKKLANIVGTENVFWLYEPVFVAENYNADAHCSNFEIIAKNLKSYTSQCLFDFASSFQRISLFLKGFKTRDLNEEEKLFLERNFISIAKEYNIEAESIKNKRFWSNLNIDLKNKKDAGKGVFCSMNCAYCYGYCGNNIKKPDWSTSPSLQNLDR